MKALKTAAKRIVALTGYKIMRAEPKAVRWNNYNPYSDMPWEKDKVVDLDAVAEISATIPGMITRDSGRLIYCLCYFQNEQGDVVEIGSWQGRSASFLARATFESQNGVFYAIDHFKGNPGKEHFYVVGKSDLSDLKAGFEDHIKRVRLEKCTNLLDMTNEQAVKKLSGKQIRFLFIDGDHTREGVQKDVGLFFPLLVDGALVVFDDYSRRFPGLMEVIDNILKQNEHSRVMIYANSLVLKYRKNTR